MPNVKISAAADAGTLLASDMLPLARSGDTNAYHATVAEISAFASTSVASGAYGNVGRNLIHNPQFLVGQRGTSFSTNGVYTLDRWFMTFSGTGAALSVNQVALVDTDRTSIGDEVAHFCLNSTVTGTSGASDYCQVDQSIEDPRRISNKTVTVSFYANSTVASFKVGVSLDQSFGSGGSPSATVFGAGQSVTLSATAGSWGHYSLTFSVPSTVGKTFGTNGDASTKLNFWFSGGSSYATRSGSVGVQTGTVNLWGVQLEIGSVATPLEKMEYMEQVIDCLRFYQAGYTNWYSYGGAGGAFQTTAYLPPMRGVPAVTLSGISLTNLSSVSALVTGTSYIVIGGTAVATGPTGFAAGWTASADL